MPKERSTAGYRTTHNNRSRRVKNYPSNWPTNIGQPEPRPCY